MPAKQKYIRQRGETIVVGVIDDGAEAADEGGVVCKIKKFPNNQRRMPSGISAAATLAAAYRAATGDVAKGWNFTLAEAASEALELGFYQIDALLPSGSGVVIIDPAIIEIREPSVK